MGLPTKVYDVKQPASFGVFASTACLKVVAACLAVTFIFFAMFPKADIAISRFFFEQGACDYMAYCGGFSAKDSPFLIALRSIFYAMPYIVLFGILIVNSAIFLEHKISFRRDLGAVTALFGCLVLGPGLLVNSILKEYILRPRPRDVSLFGGDFTFVPVGQWQGECLANCSFVSGEASLAPLMVLSIILFPKQWQKPALVVLLPASISMALLRVVVGAHFISDVLLGYGLTLLVFCLLARFILRFNGEKSKSTALTLP